MLKRALVVHIGLPKTATTFLQHWILKPALGRGFVHRTRGQRARLICHGLKELAAGDDTTTCETKEKLKVNLSGYAKTCSESDAIVISDENISGRAVQFWKGQGVGPAGLADRLGELATTLRNQFSTFRVMLGIRRQDRWLASRYAESSTVFKNFSQADFDERIVDICRSSSLGPVFEWLDYRKVHSLFSQAIGPENFFMFSMERLGRQPENVLQDLGAFIGRADLIATYEKLVENDVRVIRNKLSEGDDTWRMRRDDSILRLNRGVQDAVLTRLAESNRALDRLIPLCFDYSPGETSGPS